MFVQRRIKSTPPDNNRNCGNGIGCIDKLFSPTFFHVFPVFGTEKSLKIFRDIS